MAENTRTLYKHACFMCEQVFASTRQKKLDFCPSCKVSQHYQIGRVLIVQLRRCRKEGVQTTLTFREWMKTIQDFHGMCAYCQKRPYRCIEHFIPVKRGGGATRTNIVPACGGCNKHKASYMPEEAFSPEIVATIQQYLRGRAVR